MWLALKEKDDQLIKRLWGCGLTVSVRVRKADANDARNVILGSELFGIMLGSTTCKRRFLRRVHAEVAGFLCGC